MTMCGSEKFSKMVNNGLRFVKNESKKGVIDVTFNALEKKALNEMIYSYSISMGGLIKDSVNSGFDIDSEKEFYKKLFLYSETLNNSKDSSIEFGQLFSTFASDELKSDYDFMKTIIELNPKNCIYFIEQDDDYYQPDDEDLSKVYNLMPNENVLRKRT